MLNRNGKGRSIPPLKHASQARWHTESSPRDEEVARSAVVVQTHGGARSSKLKLFAHASFEVALPDISIWSIHGRNAQKAIL